MLIGCRQPQQVTIQVDNINARVELAESAEARQRGLMFRRSLGRDEGLLMIYPKPGKVSLWMLNTPIPLDVGFFDQDRVLRQVITMQPDGGKTLHHSPPDTRYALEMSAGWFAHYRLVPGARLHLNHQ